VVAGAHAPRPRHVDRSRPARRRGHHGRGMTTLRGL
jgi:hypothetical protein